MTIPQTIQVSQIDFGVRGRSVYNGIDELAESIEHVGLGQPIVLGQPWFEDHSDAPHYPLVAGGRRLTALISLGVTELYHASTFCPGRPGFLLREEAGTEMSNLLCEIAENRDRHDVDWRDELKMIVRAGRLIIKDGYTNGIKIIQRDLGVILGCNYNDINTAFAVYDDLVACPQDYKDCPGLRASMAVLLKKNQRFLEGLQVKASTQVQIQSESKRVEVAEKDAEEYCLAVQQIREESTVIPVTSKLIKFNGIQFLNACHKRFDHIICDPDFAVSKERLAAGATTSGEGIAQDSIETSLVDLQSFITLSHGAMKDQGFLVFFMDLDHWEKCQQWATEIGFAVQRWPLIWHKTDYRSNTSPAHNICKNIEYAMVCRKPGTVLATSPQMSSILAGPSEAAAKEFGHPFAKPRWLWLRLFSMFTSKGQSHFDPFAGSCSSLCSALEFGLDTSGAEIQEQHWNTGILNLQKEYKKLLGEHVTFQ